MIKLIDLLPSSLVDDPQVQAACESIDRQLFKINDEIPILSFWPSIDKQVSPLLDIMMWEYHVDFLHIIHDGSPLTDEKKRILIDQSIIWHQRKGTKWLMEHVLQALWGDVVNINVVEWYEYGGKPFFFKIQLSNVKFLNDPEFRERVLYTIMELKNVRSWLERFEEIMEPIHGYVYIGIVIFLAIDFTIKPHNA